MSFAPPAEKTLIQWAETYFARLFRAKSHEDLDNVFKDVFDQHSHFTVNGQRMSGSEYKKHLHDLVIEGGRVTLAFTGAVTSAKPDSSGYEMEGAVGLFLQATMDNFLVISIPETACVTASFNLTIDDDHKSIVSDSDPRRVRSLTEVSHDVRAV